MSAHEAFGREWRSTDPALVRIRAARRRYWAARESGDAAEIESSLREWVKAQLEADEVGGSEGWIASEQPLPAAEEPYPPGQRSQEATG